MPDKVGVWYSQDIGPFSQRKINSVLKSKFKAKFVRECLNNQTVRCVEFKEEYLERIKSYYIVNDTIKILDEDLRTQRTQRTPGESIQIDFKESDEHEKAVKRGPNTLVMRPRRPNRPKLNHIQKQPALNVVQLMTRFI